MPIRRAAAASAFIWSAHRFQSSAFSEYRNGTLMYWLPSVFASFSFASRAATSSEMPTCADVARMP